MRATALALCLAVAPAAAGDEPVDLRCQWKQGDVCRRTFELTIRLRGMMEVERAQRALTVQLDENADYLDTVAAVTPKLGIERILRECRGRTRTIVTKVAGLKDEKKTEKDRTEGTTFTPTEKTERFYGEILEQVLQREGVAVGDTWTAASRDATFDSIDVTCKLSEITTFKGQRTAKVYATIKVKGRAESSVVEAGLKGYAYFDIESRKVVMSDLKGSVKMKVDKVGTVHGTIRERATLAMQEREG